MRIYAKNGSVSFYFHKEMISAKSTWGNVLLDGKPQIYTKSSTFENFESALYMKSVSMPLNKNKDGGGETEARMYESCCTT